MLTVTGQAHTDWVKRTDALAAAFGVDEVRVIDAGRGVVDMELRVSDPLVNSSRALVPTRPVDLEAVVAGRTEAGGWWLVPVLYRHILIAAASGAGKSGVLWAILAGMATAIRDGLVEVWAIDPKRIELAPGKALFTHTPPGSTNQCWCCSTNSSPSWTNASTTWPRPGYANTSRPLMIPPSCWPWTRCWC